MSLFDNAHERFVKYNTLWLSQVFESYESIVACLIGPQQGHSYSFKNVVLATTLGQPGTTPILIGKKCGDNGGRTKQNLPCKREGIAHGRCGDHPNATGTPVYLPHTRLAKITIRIGEHEDRIRPLNTAFAWNLVQFQTFDHSALTALSLVGTSFSHVPMYLVWNEIILELKSILNLPPELWVVYQRQRLGVDPLWSVDHFYAQHAIHTKVMYNNVLLEPGYLLSDYNLLPEAELL